MFKGKRNFDHGSFSKNTPRLQNISSSGSSEQSDDEDSGSQSSQPSDYKRDIHFLQLSPRRKNFMQQKSAPQYDEEYPSKTRARRSNSLPLLDRVTLGIFTIPEDKATIGMKRLRFHQSEDCSLEAIVEENNDNGSHIRFKNSSLNSRKWDIK